ncbi:MAG: hypothetical protein WAX04_10990 [Oscillospiraceae bacterium]
MDKTELENETYQDNVVETKEETDEKCDDCGGAMDFDPSTGGLLCPFCGHKQQIIHQNGCSKAQELDFNSAEETGNCNWGSETKTVICKSCGGESIYDALQIAGECPYCGSNQVMEEKGKDTLAPSGVCPFKIDKKLAGLNFFHWIKHKLFCPKEAKQKAKPDAFKGIYVPYWTFDTKTTSEYTARYGKNREEAIGDGKTKTVTDWNSTKGIYTETLNDQAVIGTANHPAYLFESIEPFDTENNVEYKPEYLAGFISERYSIGLKEAWENAKSIIRKLLSKKITDKIKSQHFADRVDSLNFQTIHENITYKYLLLPVWISSFKYKRKTYQFMVNGQTGKVGGKTPVSALRVTFAILIGLAFVIGIYLLGAHG